MNTPPLIIKVEVERMKLAMIHAFSESTLKIDDYFKSAIENALNPQIIQALIHDEAKKALEQALREETRSYFLYHDGRKAIAERVKKILDEQCS